MCALGRELAMQNISFNCKQIDIISAVKWHSKCSGIFIYKVMESYSSLFLPTVSVIHENLKNKFTMGFL